MLRWQTQVGRGGVEEEDQEGVVYAALYQYQGVLTWQNITQPIIADHALLLPPLPLDGAPDKRILRHPLSAAPAPTNLRLSNLTKWNGNIIV